MTDDGRSRLSPRKKERKKADEREAAMNRQTPSATPTLFLVPASPRRRAYPAIAAAKKPREFMHPRVFWLIDDISSWDANLATLFSSLRRIMAARDEPAPEGKCELLGLGTIIDRTKSSD